MKLTPRLMVLAVFALSVAMIAGSAMTQPGGRGGRGGPGGPGGRGGPGGMMGGGGARITDLLRAEVVRTEFGIDESKAEEIQEAARTSMRASFESMGQLRELPEEERREKMGAAFAKAGQELDKKIREMLGDEKFGKLKQIQLQVAGIGALRMPEVEKYLVVTEAQKEKMRGLMEANGTAMREKMSEAFPGGFAAMRDMSEEDRAAAREKMGAIGTELRKKLEGDVMGVLTDEQKGKLKEMMGTPFAKMAELQEQMRAGRGDRGGPGQGQRGQGQRGQGQRGQGQRGQGGRDGGGQGEGGQRPQRRQRPT